MAVSREKSQAMVDKKADKNPLVGSDSEGCIQASWGGGEYPLARSSPLRLTVNMGWGTELQGEVSLALRGRV